MTLNDEFIAAIAIDFTSFLIASLSLWIARRTLYSQLIFELHKFLAI